jgi:N-acetylmuramoyl-L-alanine amidase
MKIKLIGVLSVALAFACKTPKKLYSDTNASYKKQVKSYAKILSQYPLKDSTNNGFVGTTNFNMRKPNFVIIHHTAQKSCDETLKTFTLPRTQVSAHYVVCREGNVYHMLNDYLRAWHGGTARWGNVNDINSVSIGIELDNNGAEPFSEAQIKSLLELLQQLKNSFAIPSSNFIGHSDIAPTRKVDPSKFFPWKTLSEKGFGLWYTDNYDLMPTAFNYLDGLRIIGYDIRNEKAALKAFKLHYNNTDTTAVATDFDKKIIYNLYRQVIN